MTQEGLKQLFDNNSDCYADSHDVIPAMTRDRFVEVVGEFMGVLTATPTAESMPYGMNQESEPPDSARDVMVKLSDGRELKGWYSKQLRKWCILYEDADDYIRGDWIRPGDTVVSWRETI